MASTIGIPTAADIGACATEVATNLSGRGDPDVRLANALIDVATAAKADVNALQAGTSITGVNGTTIAAGGALTTGQVLRATGAAAAGWGALNLAAAAAVTGTLPGANQAVAVAGVSQGAVTGAEKTILESIEGALTHRSVRILYSTDLAGLGAGVKTFSATLATGGDTALPANARYVGHIVGAGTFTGFDNGGGGATYTIKIGSPSDDDCIVSTANVATGQTGFPKTGTAGVRAFPMAPLYAEAFSVVLTSDADLNTATAGVVTVSLFFQVKT